MKPHARSAGKECVAIGSDLRFGVQLQTMTTDCPKVHKIHDHLYLGLSGLATDTQTLLERLTFRHNLYKLREERVMKPKTFGHMVSGCLYEKVSAWAACCIGYAHVLGPCGTSVGVYHQGVCATLARSTLNPRLSHAHGR